MWCLVCSMLKTVCSFCFDADYLTVSVNVCTAMYVSLWRWMGCDIYLHIQPEYPPMLPLVFLFVCVCFFQGFLVLNYWLRGYQMPKGVLHSWVRLELVLDAGQMQSSLTLQVPAFLTSDSGLCFEKDTLASPTFSSTEAHFLPLPVKTNLTLQM